MFVNFVKLAAALLDGRPLVVLRRAFRQYSGGWGARRLQGFIPHHLCRKLAHAITTVVHCRRCSTVGYRSPGSSGLVDSTPPPPGVDPCHQHRSPQHALQHSGLLQPRQFRVCAHILQVRPQAQWCSQLQQLQHCPGSSGSVHIFIRSLRRHSGAASGGAASGSSYCIAPAVQGRCTFSSGASAGTLVQLAVAQPATAATAVPRQLRVGAHLHQVPLQAQWCS